MSPPASQAPPSNRQTTRTRRTREKIADAAFALFEDKGFENVTVEDIAAKAGISRRTFFRHFPTKEASAFPFSQERIEFLKMIINGQTRGAPLRPDTNLLAFEQVAAFFESNAELMARQRRVVDSSEALKRYEAEVNQQWADAVAEAIDPGTVQDDGNKSRPSVYAQAAAGAVVGALLPVFRAWYAGGTKGDFVAMGKRALSAIHWDDAFLVEHSDGRSPRSRSSSNAVPNFPSDR